MTLQEKLARVALRGFARKVPFQLVAQSATIRALETEIGPAVYGQESRSYFWGIELVASDAAPPDEFLWMPKEVPNFECPQQPKQMVIEPRLSSLLKDRIFG